MGRLGDSLTYFGSPVLSRRSAALQDDDIQVWTPKRGRIQRISA